MNRLTENLLLFMVGLAIAVIAKSGTFTRYVKPSLLPWLVAAAVFVMALAVIAMVRDARRSIRAGDEHRPRGGHAHSPSIAWLLVLPVAALVFVPAPALSAPAAAPSTNNDNTWVERRHAFPPLPAARAPTLALTDVLVRLSDDTAGTLDGRLITVNGFTLKKGADTYLGRFYIICCAADARLHRLTLDGPGAAVAAGYPQDTWLSVEGRVVPAAEPQGIPHLVVSSVQPVAEPADPYEYPT